MKKKEIVFVAILAMISMFASACSLLGGQTTPFEDGAESGCSAFPSINKTTPYPSP